jgi:hypothetical protein
MSAPTPTRAAISGRRAFVGAASFASAAALARAGSASARAARPKPRGQDADADARKPPRNSAGMDADGPVTRVELRGRRLVAIGDLHGDFIAMVKSLELAGVMDGNGKWCGGDAVVVQVGDILDRGDSELAIMRKLKVLGKQAKEQGGDVIVMNGNHEIMNVMGDFRYVTSGAFDECRRYVEKKKSKAKATGEAAVSVDTDDEEDEALAGVRARQALFKPGGEMANWMAKQPTVLVVGGTVFAHAGIDTTHVDYGFERINKEVSLWMQGKTKLPPKQVLESDGVVWTREYGGKDAGVQYDAQACRRLSSALEAADAKRLVIGHTPQTSGVNSGCKGSLWRVDVGSSRGIYGNAAQVIEIVGGKVRVLA